MTDGSSGGFLPTIIMVVALIAIFYFFLIRPESKKKKKAQEMRDNLSVGDTITTIGGLIGKIVNINSDSITSETSEDRVRIQVTKWAISSVGKQTEENPQK
ncbi:MAG: preprotein translocase subunit YajC [Oscillospiraceae bacterium]|nr:preprotein translocase subunit YajC [Oscillospiraceae bacterium]